jgi:hypothetical protein
MQRGEYDVALTLAGAAEGMIERNGPHMFAHLRDSQLCPPLPVGATPNAPIAGTSADGSFIHRGHIYSAQATDGIRR